MAAMRQHRRRWRRLLLLASAAAAAVHGSARAKGAGGDLVAPGALRPYDGAPAEKRKRGTVRHPAAGFFVAGSSIEDMNGVYARVHTVGGCIDTLYAATARRHAAGCGACWCCPVALVQWPWRCRQPPHAVSVTQPLSAHTAGYCAGTQAPPDIQHDFHYIYRKWPVHERDDMSGWHLALVASPDEDDDYNAVDPEKASEWLFIDPDRADRFGHPGDTIIPGAGRKWSHLHRRQRSATFRDNSDSRAAPPSTGPPARVEEDDLNELPWQVIFLSKPEKVYAYRHEEAAHHRTVRLAVAVRIL
jgi:hypothetical protein